jgi:hypothetical protein
VGEGVSDPTPTAAASVAYLGLGRAWIGDSGPLDFVDASLTMHGPEAIYLALAGDNCTAGGFTFHFSIGWRVRGFEKQLTLIHTPRIKYRLGESM